MISLSATIRWNSFSVASDRYTARGEWGVGGEAGRRGSKRSGRGSEDKGKTR